MILKIKKDDFNWVYVETTHFEIQKTYEIAPKQSGLEPNDLSYKEAKEQKIINIDTTSTAPHLEKDGQPLRTFVFTDDTIIACVGDFTGFVLNDKGQTVERL